MKFGISMFATDTSAGPAEVAVEAEAVHRYQTSMSAVEVDLQPNSRYELDLTTPLRRRSATGRGRGSQDQLTERSEGRGFRATG